MLKRVEKVERHYKQQPKCKAKEQYMQQGSNNDQTAYKMVESGLDMEGSHADPKDL